MALQRVADRQRLRPCRNACLAPQARRIVEADFPALPIEICGDGVAGKAGFGAGDHPLLAQKRIGERRFSGVGPPRDRELERPAAAFAVS